MAKQGFKVALAFTRALSGLCQGEPEALILPTAAAFFQWRRHSCPAAFMRGTRWSDQPLPPSCCFHFRPLFHPAGTPLGDWRRTGATPATLSTMLRIGFWVLAPRN